ncbi:type IX secretion system outer membrane channel protein PorV [Labilibaculum sp. DW002]|uniref:Type IX secretion system outer membrane channel protein PorV n=1 Tax=Paralabilibaculum antarcticum TaxID=2912572 RepID=A0ABT5VUK4_9BACT|nr:type IX secretion system outer membrane channel protein PorV [Labilibaculum sp. DW002]MDE5419106.1 type IX secretion system outer membrane channel protein PorV [Labilibaculum sp. DW002]
MKFSLKYIIICFVLVVFTSHTKAQENSVTGANYISTAVPFLTITPDARAGAMGNNGVATSPDLFSMHWNAAKYSFAKEESGIGVSYTPWLREVANDMSVSYLSAYYKLDQLQTIAGSMRYFSLGDIFFQERLDEIPVKRQAYEFAFDLAYSRKLSEALSGAISFRYIYSDIVQGNSAAQSASVFAADLSLYYKKEYGSSSAPSIWSWGLNISNIGSKVKYYEDAEREFIPVNLKIGTAYKYQIDTHNSISFSVDMNKLLVPSSAGRRIEMGGKSEDIISSPASNNSVMGGVFNSFTDAPGGFREELHEITLGFGAEYWYQNQFAARTGYFYEHESKGNRKYFSAGVGVKLDVFNVDFAYLIPTATNHPLQNTLRISLSANLDFKSLLN